MKNRIQAMYGFGSFPAREFAGAFRDNIRELIGEFFWKDEEEVAKGGCAATWRTTLIEEKSDVAVPAYIAEECVDSSSTPFCDYCRCAGWGHHLVSKRRYHIIVPASDEWDQPLPQNLIHRQTHLLHGLLHCNGYGHLLSIRAHASEKHLLTFRGHVLMDFWDRLCLSLRTRSVSIEDLSVNSLSLPLRLLHVITRGLPWFARWGYEFSHGCFGITELTYRASVDRLSSLCVDLLVSDLPDLELASNLRRIVTLYYRLSGQRFGTVRDLLRYLLDLNRQENYPPALDLLPGPTRAPKKHGPTSKKRKRCRDFDEVAEGLQSRWPVRRLRYAAEVIVEALRESGTLTRQEVRDAARLMIGDTGLIDFVVKSIGDTIVSGQAVRRTPHPRTRVLEFSLDDLDSTDQEKPEPAGKTLTWPSKEELLKDIDTVYKAVVQGREDDARTILDSKHWAKHWDLRDESDDLLRFVVEWRPRPWEMAGLRRPLPPGEVVVVEPHASVGDLVVEAERALRDTYCVMEKFRAKGIEGVAGEEWEPVMSGGAQSGSTIGVIGDKVDLESSLRYEGGDEVVTVGCGCGAREDDGERMVACYSCEVWHHTRCVGVPDDESVPHMFLCPRCGGALLDDGGGIAAAIGWKKE
ncbi:hypothetical protein LUZ60_006240 [Juncus effusus]|nr:hypothetical protein LUZ60_006240 [Juncus effusus]